MRTQLKSFSLIVFALFFSFSVPFFGGASLQAQNENLLPCSSPFEDCHGGSPTIPKDNCNFEMIIDLLNGSLSDEFCVGTQLDYKATLLLEGKGPGSYTYQWEVVNSSAIQIVGASNQAQVRVSVTGERNSNTLKCTVTRMGCSDDVPNNDQRIYLQNVDTKIAVPSLSLNLGTCGGFPSTNPHWQLNLSASPNTVVRTVWSGGNITYLSPSNANNPNTRDYAVQVAPNSPGNFYVSVAAYNKCGVAAYTSRNFNTNDCSSGGPVLLGSVNTNQLEENQLEESIIPKFLGIAPNPINESTTSPLRVAGINKDNLNDYSLSIFDRFGQKVLITVASESIDLSSVKLQAGIYIVRLQNNVDDSIVFTERLLVK